MPLDLSADERAHLTPAELEVLTSAEADTVLAGTPASLAPTEGDAAPSAEPTPAPAEAHKAADTDTDAPASADTPAQRDDEHEAPFAPTFQGKAPDNYAQVRQELLAKKAEAFKKLMDGEMEADDYAQLEAEVLTQLDDLNAARIRAETLNEANQQTQLALQQREISRIIKTAKKAGEVDYLADTTAQVQFDAMLSALSAVPANASRDFAELVDEAHRAVLALRGVTPKAATPSPVAPSPTAPAAAKPPAAAPTGPRTLAGLPNAAPAVVADDLEAKLATLEGEDAERFLASLPPQQVERLLRKASMGA